MAVDGFGGGLRPKPEKIGRGQGLFMRGGEATLLGNGEAESAALTEFAFHPNISAVEFNQRLADSQSQAGSRR